MNYKRLELGPIATNCYIFYNGSEALIIDPGGDSSRVTQTLEELELIPQAVLLTHAHFDHIGAVEDIRDIYNIPVYLHSSEWEWMKKPELNGSALFPVDLVTVNLPEYPIEEGNVSVGGFHFEVRHTPGHSPGSVSFINHDNELVFSGDVLFNQGVGRTDLPGGNMDELLESIELKLYTLADNYKILPGHGPVTTIGDEKRKNPFVRR